MRALILTQRKPCAGCCVGKLMAFLAYEHLKAKSLK